MVGRGRLWVRGWNRGGQMPPPGPDAPSAPPVNLGPLQRLTDDSLREIFGSCPTGGKTPRDSSNAANIVPLWSYKNASRM